ncbi:molybdenum cofactor guanylyltransferase [Glycomyces halotolerans]
MGDTPSGLAALFLVGGRARRLAGAPKSELVVGGRTILERMLAACDGAAKRIVVGRRPPDAAPLPEGVEWVVEDPPGSGPARAVAAGLQRVPAEIGRVVILPGDLPFLCAGAIKMLRRAAEETGPEGGAMFCDGAGRRQWLCGVWPTAAVRANAEAAGPGEPARHLFTGIKVKTVEWDYSGPPPWFDCDTPEDLEQARQWAAAQ